MDSHYNDILLVEQIDRLTGLSNSDWITRHQELAYRPDGCDVA